MNIKKLTSIFLQLIIICALLLALLTYTSKSPISPLYDNCGTQFLIIILVSSPLILLTGLLTSLLNIKLKLPKYYLWFPFYTGVGITIPLFVDGSLSSFTIISGVILCLIFLVQAFILSFKIFKFKTA